MFPKKKEKTWPDMIFLTSKLWVEASVEKERHQIINAHATPANLSINEPCFQVTDTQMTGVFMFSFEHSYKK